MSSIKRTLIIEIEERDDGKLMVSTRGNPDGDWLRRDVREPARLALALLNVDDATHSRHDEPLGRWMS